MNPQVYATTGAAVSSLILAGIFTLGPDLNAATVCLGFAAGSAITAFVRYLLNL